MVNGLRSRGWWAAAGARFRLGAEAGVRVTAAGLLPEEGRRFAADFAEVLGEYGVGYGG